MNHSELAELVRRPEHWNSITGYFDFQSLYARIVAEAPPGSILVELGCMLGRSLCCLGTLARDADKSLRVVGIDHCRGTPDPADLAGVPLATTLGGSFAGVTARNIHACGLSDHVALIVAEGEVAARLFADGSVFFVMIDGSHVESDVVRDIKTCFPKVGMGGVLAGHDYGNERFGVTAAVHRFFGEGNYTDPDASTCWSVRKS